MATLHVSLHSGFSGDEVVVLVNGDEAFCKEDVSTRYQVGLAGSFEVEVPQGTARLRVELPQRQLAGETALSIEAAEAYVAVSVQPDRQILFERSNQPFRYL